MIFDVVPEVICHVMQRSRLGFLFGTHTGVGRAAQRQVCNVVLLQQILQFIDRHSSLLLGSYIMFFAFSILETLENVKRKSAENFSNFQTGVYSLANFIYNISRKGVNV